MATEETTPEEAVGDSRLGGSDAFKLAVANLIGGLAADAGASTLASLANQTVSLHKADPGSTGGGGTELTGGGYARKPVVWNPATDDGGSPGRGKITGNPITFDVPAGDITHYGVWCGGVYLYGKSLNPAVNLSAPGKVTITPTHAYGLQ